ncbi:peroxisomal d3,d2-enoyl-CoA isomerase [Hyaloraphidium curvatum]|nr:peroxisomal d3,d2-enoyl-CoA isomerase [Hyaloraphidium curvatum]
MAPYTDIAVETHGDGRIGVIRFARGRSLNSIGGRLVVEVKDALRKFDADPRVVFTVLTGEGRGFCSGADVKSAGRPRSPTAATFSEKKEAMAVSTAPAVDLLRLMLDHSKVLIMAVNGPAVGGGAAWFLGLADLVYISDSAYMRINFSSLGIPAEAGIGFILPQHIGVRRAAEAVLLGTTLDAAEMKAAGVANRIFPTASFFPDVLAYLASQLEHNDPSAILTSKKLMAGPLRAGRMAAIEEAMDKLAEAFIVEGSSVTERFAKQAERIGGWFSVYPEPPDLTRITQAVARPNSRQ